MTAYVGQIIAWSEATPPENWLICDGTGGTPDLRGLFIYGKYNDSDSPITGGSATHGHVGGTVTTVSDHSHSVSVSLASVTTSSAYSSGTVKASSPHSHSGNAGTTSSNGQHSHTVNLSDADGLPPLILLYFIKKVV